MIEPFSVAASSFAVVGVADVVLRAGKEVYQFLNAIKDAPAEVERLRQCIHDNALVVQESKRYWEELKQSASSISSSTTSLSQAFLQFISPLRSLDRELSALGSLVKRYKGVTSWGRIKWVFDERKILKSLQKLEMSKSTLTALLVLVGRRHDLLFEENIERDIHEGFQKIKCTIDSQLQTLGQRMREVQDGLSADQAKFETTTLRLATQVVAMQKGFHSTNRNALRQHSKTRDQITQGNTKIIHSICSKIEELPGNLAQTYLTARKNGREVRFNGESLEAMLSPLLLLKPGLRQAIIKLLSQHSELSSAQHLYWLQSEFENLVSSATQEVAAISEGSTATPFDTWVYSRKVASLLSIQNSPSRMAISRKRSRHKHELSNEQTVSEAKVQRKRLKSKSQSFSFTLPTGEVQIMVSRPDGGSPSGSRPCDVSEVGFSFSPKPDISSTSIHGRFVKAMDPLPQPRLYAELNAFNVMEDLYPEYYMELIHDGTLEEIDTALRVGKISPYNINKNGQNICLHLAAYYRRSDLFPYFDSQGIGPSNLGESGALMGLWDCLRLREGKRLDVDSLFKVLAHLEKTDAISEFDDSGSLLHATIWSSAVDSSEETTTSLRRWMNFLKNEEYDFEGAEHGRTPLLDHLGSCGFASLEMTGLLLEFGVNVHATTPLGRNALQCAIYSSKEEEDREILEQKLCILIKAGVDVDHCDEYGYSPSDYAQEGWFDCWDEWCRALESNGLKIDYVTKADEERRKIYRESRRLEEWWDSAGEWDSAKNAVDVAADHTKKYQEEPPS